MTHLEPAFPGWLLVLLPLMTAERLLEVVVARRNTRWARTRGTVESGRGHYPVMVALHVAFLAGIVLEIIALPLVYGAWTTALLFTVANAALLSVRLRAEDAALRLASAASSSDGQRTVTTPLAPRSVGPGRLP
ncbi:isoprenylcysteine carboxylmethyltransferase family protein [Streptomyces longwoodensis]|uniref:isoprenylcysteine carboxylmethyltransferase family protein n=1 Tax=Streptomyces longwoodensis TaxID=68231 RepID=UPI00386FAA73